MKNYALLSCYDKANLDQLAPTLLLKGYELLASGGTYEHLRKLNMKVTEVSELTGKGEIFGGRVKTLQYEILGSILLRCGKDEKDWPHDYRIGAVVCNFYPFADKAQSLAETQELLEWIDIGGPTMVRSAAKNYPHVYVLTSPSQYSWMRKNPFEDDMRMRQELALAAFDLIYRLDERICFELHSRLRKELRYGENPHQKAVFVQDPAHETLGELSFNNIRDAEAALKFVSPFRGSAACVIKHGTLCGAAVSTKDDLNRAFEEAWEGDIVSRFGGILGFNRCPTKKIMDDLSKKFVEVVVLPRSADSKAWADEFRRTKPQCRVFLYDQERTKNDCLEVFSSCFGSLIQSKDESRFADQQEDTKQLEKFFAIWTAACSKSNAVTLVGSSFERDFFFLAGAGQGQPNRVECLEKLALPRAQDYCARRGCKVSDLICSSDAFFPFDDIVKLLAKAGIRRVIQPGGSKNDPVVLNTAQELGVELFMSGERHFWH